MSNVLEYVMRLSDGAFRGPLGKSRDELGRFTKTLNTIDSGKVNNLGSAFTGLAAKIGGAFIAIKAGMGVFDGLKSAISRAADMESTNVAFKTLIGSAVMATTVLGQLKTLGAETPFEFPELANAGRSLIAFGEGATTVAETLRRVGDVASGVQSNIGDIAEIYGKARVQGSLFAEDINQLTGRGIPIIQQFARILNVTESEVKGIASEGKITFPLLDQAFRNLTAKGGQFFQMMAQQSGTMKGLWSTLMDGVNELYLALGEPINDALKPILQDAIGLVGKLGPMAAALGQAIAPALEGIRNFVAEAESGGNVVMMLGERLREAFAGLIDIALVPIRVMGAALPGFGSAFMNVVIPVGDYLSTKFQSVALLFGRTLMQKMSEVMAQMPSWLVGDAPSKLNQAANSAGKEGNLKALDADRIAATLPDAVKSAANEIARGVAEAKAKMNEEIKRFTDRQNETKYGVMPEWESHGMATGEEGPKAPGLEKAIADAVEKGTTKKPKEKASSTGEIQNAGVSRISGSDAEDGGRKRIMGFSRKKAGLADFGGLGEYDALQDLKKMGIRPGERTKQRYGGAYGKVPGTDDAAAGGESTKAKETRGFSGLAGFDALQKAKGAGIRPGERFKAPSVPSPGTTKKEQERREASAAVQRDRPRWDVVQAIEKHLANLTVA